ncbi:MAG: hypothetical protein GX799_02935 [Crenarchaeota archaeon]|jgi:hypothetical protein|nr:hypothetical protein [Thermoproteota archaeon]
MTPIVKLYWLRVTLGITAGLLSALLAASGIYQTADYTVLINSITVALAVYIVTYYLLKIPLKKKIEQQSKILTTGIGIYFFSWIAFFVLFYTVIRVLTI